MIVHFIFVDARHSFFVWMRTGSYPPDSNKYEKYINNTPKNNFIPEKSQMDHADT